MEVTLEYITHIVEVGTFDDGNTAVRLGALHVHGLGLAVTLPVNRERAVQLAGALYRKAKVTVSIDVLPEAEGG